MRILAVVVLAVPFLLAQSNPIASKQIKPINIGKLDLGMKGVHIHTMPGNCKGAGDSVYGKSGKVYYACIGQQEVCSVAVAHKGAAIPGEMIAAFDAHMAEFDARQKEFKAELVRTGRSTGNRDQDFANSMAKHDARVGRTSRGAVAPAVTSVPVAPPVVARAAVSAVPDEKLKEVAIGVTVTEAVAKLGAPYSRIAGDSERLTYKLESGGMARLEFEGGKLAAVRVTAAQ